MNRNNQLLRKLSLVALLAGVASYSSAEAQDVLSLQDCRELAKANSRVLLQKDQDIKVAEAKRQEVFTKFFPQVSARGIYLHMEKEFKLIDWSQPLGAFNFVIPDRLRGLGTIDLRNVWVGNVAAIQPIYMGGKIINGYKMAGMAERLQRELKQTAAVEVESKVDEAYWQVVSLASKEKLLLQMVSLLEQTVKDVDASIKSGVATKADGLTVRTKLSEAQLKLSQVQNGLDLSRMLLGNLCGTEEVQTKKLVDEDLINTPSLVESKDHDPSPDIDEALERRSEIRSLRIVDSIYAKRVALETSALAPKVYGFASYSMTNPNSFNGTKKTFGGQYYLGMMLEIPISDLFSGTYRRRQAQAEHRAKQIELSEARSKISLQMKQALRNSEDARKRYQTASKAVTMAQENMRYALLGYQEGVIPLLNYTMAQTAWMNAQDGLIDAIIEVRLSDSKLQNILAR